MIGLLIDSYSGCSQSCVKNNTGKKPVEKATEFQFEFLYIFIKINIKILKSGSLFIIDSFLERFFENVNSGKNVRMKSQQYFQ